MFEEMVDEDAKAAGPTLAAAEDKALHGRETICLVVVK